MLLKRMKRMRHMLLCCLLTAWAATPCASSELHFEHIDTHGHAVFSIFRDADGIVWAGTSNGLTTIAQLQSSRPFGYVRHEALNEIICNISQDNTGRLWLTTNSEHLVVYDARRNHTITRIDSLFRRLGLQSCREQLSCIDGSGRLWTSNGRELFLFSFKDGKKQKIALPGNHANIVALQGNNEEMLVATRTGIYSCPIHAPAPVLVAPPPIALPDNRIIMVNDKSRNLWLAADNKLFRHEAATGQWSLVDGISRVKDILATPTGHVYIASTNHGLYVVSAQGNGKPYNMKQTPPNTDGLWSNHIESLYFDQPRQALVVTYNKSDFSIGTLQNDKYSIHRLATAANQFQPEDITSFAAPPRGGYFWAGSEDGGLFRVEDAGNYPVMENSFRGHTVCALLADSNGQLWAGFYAEGLQAPDGRMHFKGNSPYALAQPAPGGRIFAALLGQGIAALDPQTGQTQTIKTDNPWIQDLAAANGHLYAMTNSYIYDIDASTLAVRRTPTTVFGSGNKLMEGHRDILADSRGWLWAVSNVNHAPLYIYDTATGKARALGETEQYIVYSICADPRGDVWCTTDQGLLRISTDGQTFAVNRYMFNVRRDFNYNMRALYALPSGHLVAGTTRGFISFAPQLLTGKQQDTAPTRPPIMTLLRVNSQIVQPLQSDGLAPRQGSNAIGSDLIYLRELDLSHEEKNLVIECRPRGFMTEMAYQYYYQLKGYSDQWLPMNNYILSLSNLPPGRYELLLRTAPKADEEPEVFSMLRIRIRPPFRQSPWGILLSIVILGLLAWWLFVFVRNRQRYRKEISLIEQQKQQEAEMNEMKTRFFTNVSHDLRTPLTLIIAPIDELIKRFTGKKAEDNTLFMLTTVKRNADRLLALVNQILDVRKTSWGEESLYMQTCNITQLVNDTAQSFSSVAQQRGIRLNVSMPERPLTMDTDEEKLKKIISNLVSNSFKFTPDKGAIDIIGNVRHDGERQWLQLTIADTGKGIAANELPHIFERYYYSRQLHSSHESSGIGLSIVKQYVELMEGSISVEPNQPQGTRFIIELPFPQPTDLPEDLPQTGPEAQAEAGSQAHPHTILLADDNADLLNFMATSLANDFNILTATNGKKALQLLSNEDSEVDLIVSDIMMPDMDGLELVRQIKHNINLSHIPVILLTAKAMEEDQLEGLQMGASDYITKPFNMEILRLRIGNWMQRRRAARENFNRQPSVEPEQLTITTIDQQLLQKAVSAVSEHMHEPDFNVDQLAAIIGIHRTGLNRKLQFITGQTPIVFIRTLRLKRAHQLLLADPSLNVSQVAYQVGFNNPKLFSRYFHEQYGQYPSDMTRRQHTGNAPAGNPAE